MKYLAIFYTDDGANIRTFNNPESRKRNTCEAIYGDCYKANMDTFLQYEFLELSSQGVVSFEGDPPIKWVDIPKGFTFEIILREE